jgi:hypothetical protein
MYFVVFTILDVKILILDYKYRYSSFMRVCKIIFHFNAVNWFAPISINSASFDANCLLADRRAGEGGE